MLALNVWDLHRLKVLNGNNYNHIMPSVYNLLVLSLFTLFIYSSTFTLSFCLVPLFFYVSLQLYNSLKCPKRNLVRNKRQIQLSPALMTRSHSICGTKDEKLEKRVEKKTGGE